MKTSPRSEKLAGVIAEILPVIVQELTTPNQVGLLTLVRTEVASDLGVVQIWLSSIGGKANWLDSVTKKSKKIRYEILKKVDLRREFELRIKGV